MADALVSTSAQPKPNIPTYLPVADAAKKFGMPKKLLTQMAQTGKIEAVRLPSGELLVSAEKNGHEPETKEEIIGKEYSHLQDSWLTVSRAAEKYEVPGTTIREWLTLDYIETDDDSYPMELNEAEMAYCANVYHTRKKSGIRSGAPLLDEKGLPYKLKHPKLSKYRRRKRQKQ